MSPEKAAPDIPGYRPPDVLGAALSQAEHGEADRISARRADPFSGGDIAGLGSAAVVVEGGTGRETEDENPGEGSTDGGSGNRSAHLSLPGRAKAKVLVSWGDDMR
jgi:hypothetical protein